MNDEADRWIDREPRKVQGWVDKGIVNWMNEWTKEEKDQMMG